MISEGLACVRIGSLQNYTHELNSFSVFFFKYATSEVSAGLS
jgi:hypothetical protein